MADPGFDVKRGSGASGMAAERAPYGASTGRRPIALKRTSGAGGVIRPR